MYLLDLPLVRGTSLAAVTRASSLAGKVAYHFRAQSTKIYWGLAILGATSHLFFLRAPKGSDASIAVP